MAGDPPEDEPDDENGEEDPEKDKRDTGNPGRDGTKTEESEDVASTRNAMTSPMSHLPSLSG